MNAYAFLSRKISKQVFFPETRKYVNNSLDWFAKTYCYFWFSDVQKSGRSKLGTKAGLQRAINQFAQEKKTELMKTDTGE